MPLIINAQNTHGMQLKRISAVAVGRDRTQAEKARRHIYGDTGAKFSKGKYMVLLGSVLGTVTTFATKDNICAEIYETT